MHVLPHLIDLPPNLAHSCHWVEWFGRGILKNRNLNSNQSRRNQSMSYSDFQLIQAIISNVVCDQECQRISRNLLYQFEDVRTLLRTPASEIMRKANTSQKVADELSRMHELLQAIQRTAIANRPLFDDYQIVLDYCRTTLASEKREQFHALFLDKSFHLITHECLQIGTVDHVFVYPRELMTRALLNAASAIILVHNHPSGNAIPGNADCKMTAQLQEVSSFFGILIVDHIIVGATGNFSFREHGMISQQKKASDFREDGSIAIPEQTNHED